MTLFLLNCSRQYYNFFSSNNLEWEEIGIKMNEECLNNLRFDTIVLMSESMNELQQMILHKECQNIKVLRRTCRKRR